MEHKSEVPEKNPIQVADRLFRTLEVLAEAGPTGLMELSSALSLNKSTVHRILNSLICMGYVKQNPETSKYSLTFKIWDLANQLLTQNDIADIARPHLKELVAKCGETVHLVQIDGLDAVYIDKVESQSNSVRMVSKVGKRIPLYCSGVGKALLAEMDPKDVKAIWDESEIYKDHKDLNDFLCRLSILLYQSVLLPYVWGVVKAHTIKQAYIYNNTHVLH